MNREIKFRGKRTDNGEWIYGCASHGFRNDKIEYIMPKCYFATRDMGERDESGNPVIEDEIAVGGFIPVRPDTVGQYTGLKDKDGKEIYEGDKFEGDDDGDFFVVEWVSEEAVFGVSLYGYDISTGEGGQEVYDNKISRVDINCFSVRNMRDDVVIGNIHDNPELINN